jgi:hypothetical protein
LIYRATSIFDLYMRIFNLQGLGAPDKPKKKKKIKYAEIDFTSNHSFLRLRKVKKINLKLPHTKKTQPSVQYSSSLTRVLIRRRAHLFTKTQFTVYNSREK